MNFGFTMDRNMYIMAAVALIGLIIFLVLTMVSAFLKRKKSVTTVPDDPYTSLLQDDAEDVFEKAILDAGKWWPYLQYIPLFKVGVVLSCIMIGLDFVFGIAIGGLALGLIVIGPFFAAADFSLPFMTYKTDTGEGNWYSKSRPIRVRLAIWLATMLSFISVIGSTGEVATTSSASKTTQVVNYNSEVDNISESREELKKLKVKKQEQDIQPVASEMAELKYAQGQVSYETNKGGCGPRCMLWKEKVRKYQSRVGIAQRIDELRVGSRKSVKSLTSGKIKVRRDEDPLASALSGLSGGSLSKDFFRKYMMTIIGTILVLLTTIIHLMIGDELGERRAAGVARVKKRIERRRKGIKAGDTLLTNDQHVTNFVLDDPEVKVNEGLSLFLAETHSSYLNQRKKMSEMYTLYINWCNDHSRNVEYPKIDFISEVTTAIMTREDMSIADGKVYFG